MDEEELVASAVGTLNSPGYLRMDSMDRSRCPHLHMIHKVNWVSYIDGQDSDDVDKGDDGDVDGENGGVIYGAVIEFFYQLVHDSKLLFHSTMQRI